MLNGGINRILVAVDLAEAGIPGPLEAREGARIMSARTGSGSAGHVMGEAVALALTLGASLEIAYVRRGRAHFTFDAPVNAEPDEIDDWIDCELAKLGRSAAEAGVSCTTTSLRGSVRRTLVSHIRKMKPDLIVLGGHRRWHGLASCAEHRLLRARQRVLVVPAARADA